MYLWANSIDMSDKKQHEFVFGKENYILLMIGILIVVVGFTMMSGGGSDDPNIFSEEIFSARRITVAPTVVLAGYGFILYAIMRKKSIK